MYTDEYDISLKRELSVCRSFIRKIERFIVRMENKYNLKTAVFIQRVRQGDAGNSRDYILWKDKYEELERWKERESHYKDMLNLTGR